MDDEVTYRSFHGSQKAEIVDCLDVRFQEVSKRRIEDTPHITGWQVLRRRSNECSSTLPDPDIRMIQKSKSSAHQLPYAHFLE